jgi:hypothetical protein
MTLKDWTSLTTTHAMKGMHQMNARIALTLSALTLAATLAPAVHAGGPPLTGRGGGPGAAPACAVKFIVGQQACFAPSAAAQAEKSAPWAIRPNAAVKLTFGLPLSQVSTWRQTPGGKVAEIDYLYGPLRHDYGRQAAQPVAIRIAEYNTRANESRYRTAWTHDVCGVKVEISPAADPARAHPTYGPWYLIANMKHGNRSIGIVANAGQSMLQTLACRILQTS